MSTYNTTESPIINSAISSEELDDGTDANSCCAQWLPAGQRWFYIKIVMAMCVVAGGGMFGLYMLCKLFAG